MENKVIHASTLGPIPFKASNVFFISSICFLSLFLVSLIFSTFFMKSLFFVKYIAASFILISLKP